MIVYIAGPMRGIEDYNTDAFNEAEHYLVERGYTVINPAKLPKDLPPKSYAPICTSLIDASDAVFLLDGSEKSKGACAECAYAEWQGKKIFSVDNIEK